MDTQPRRLSGGAGWALQYTLVSTTAAYSIIATASGDDYAITVPASTTTAWAAGRYALTEYVTDGTERYTLATSTVMIAANLAAASAGIDNRTHARKVLDSIEAWLERARRWPGKFSWASAEFGSMTLPICWPCVIATAPKCAAKPRWPAARACW